MARKKKYDYFAAFEEQAKAVVEEAELLVEVIENFTTADDIKAVLPKAHEIENNGDQLNHRTYNAIAADFVTPIDREDLIDISSSLDEIIDELEATVILFYMMDIQKIHSSCPIFARYLVDASHALLTAIQEFPNFKKSETFRGAIAKVNDCEEAADNAYTEVIHQLFAEEKDNAVYVLAWSRIFDQMEDCCDAIEHVGDVLETVLLKES